MNNSLNLFNTSPVSATVRERLAIADKLTALYELPDPSEPADVDRASNPVDISRILVNLIEDSELEHAQRSCRTVLRQLVRRPDFARLAGPFGLGEDDFFLITEDGELLQTELPDDSLPFFEFTNVIDTVTHAIADSKDTLEQLSSAAKLAGGIISSNHYIPFKNWLAFYQLDTPATIQDITHLVDFLKLQLPVAPVYGNYWGGPDDAGELQLAISRDQYGVVRQCIAQSVNNNESGPQSLLDFLADAMLEQQGRSRAFLQEDPEPSWALMVDTPQARTFALTCMSAMDPHASTAPTPLTHHQRSALLVAAILLEFGLAETSDRHFYQSFHLYEPRYVQATRNEIIEKFTDIAINTYNVHPHAAPLALHLIFAGLAPEFLVTTPPSLQLGSFSWVVLRKSVMLAESIAPGLSRRMTYESLKDLAGTVPVSQPQQALHNVIMTRCILDWSTVNGLDPHATEDMPTQSLVEQALARFSAFQGQLSQALKDIAMPPVSRRALARAAIEGAGVNPGLIVPIANGPGETLLDLYMANRLSAYNVAWTGPLQQLEPANTLYTREIDRQFLLHQKGVGTLTRLALMENRLDDRVAIEQGHIALYRLVRVLSFHSGEPLRTEADLYAAYGVVMLSRVNETVCAYELFPLQGVCRKNEVLSLRFNETPVWLEGDAQFKAQIVMFHESMNPAYFNGKPSDSQPSLETHNYVLERFARFDRAEVISYQRSPMQSYESQRFQAIAEQLVKHNPPLPYDAFHAMGYDKTASEASDERLAQVFETILNIIIPFKECIEGLASGRQDRRSSALFACVMDATLLLFAFVGAAGTFAKALSSSARLLHLSKVGGVFVLSLFNPLDGVPQLLQGGVKLLGKSAFKLGHYGLSVTQSGARQLRRLMHSSSGSYDLVRALGKSGSAAEIRMGLPTVAHARALFKDDTLETLEQVVTRLSEKNISIPKDVSVSELQHLFNNSVREAAIPLRPVQDLESSIGATAVNELLTAFIKVKPGSFDGTRFAFEAKDYVQRLGAVAEIEAKKITYLKNHQQSVLAKDLGKAPYSDVMPESAFNPDGLIDDARRAAAWMLNGSTSAGNDVENIVAILREYTSNKKSLLDPLVIQEIHARLVPELAGSVRQAGAASKYGGSITGFALLEQHLKTLDATHRHVDKQLLAAIAGFQGFGDGNGRTASAVYAISQLRNKQFTPMPKHVFLLLSDLG